MRRKNAVLVMVSLNIPINREPFLIFIYVQKKRCHLISIQEKLYKRRIELRSRTML